MKLSISSIYINKRNNVYERYLFGYSEGKIILDRYTIVFTQNLSFIETTHTTIFTQNYLVTENILHHFSSIPI